MAWSIRSMHGDIITAVPEGFVNLGETDVCEFQGMIKLVDPAGTVEPSNVSIFTVQGEYISCWSIESRHP